MAVETFGHIDSLNTANPTSSDPKSEGDDHLRGIKTALKNSFPNVTGAVTATQVELNALTDKASGTSSGIDVTGSVTADGLTLGDDDVLTLGDANEFTLKHHNSGYTHLTNTTGTLYIDSDSVTFRDDDGSPDNVVISQSGINVTGSVTAVGGSSLSKFERSHSTTTAPLAVLDIKAKSTGDMADGFGAAARFIIEDTAGVENVVAEINAVRSGADNLADIQFETQDTTRMTITSTGNVEMGGNLDVSGVIYGDSGASGNLVLKSTSGNSNRSSIEIGTILNSDNGGISFSTAGTSVAATRMRISGTTGNVEVSTGHIVIGTAGKGIDFSGQTSTTTTGASASSGGEVLDHYEEGTWTPVITGYTGGDTQTYSSQIGHYTKIGNTVFVSFKVRLSDKGNISGLYTMIKGMPFNHSGTNAGSASLDFWWSTNSSKAFISAELGGGSPTVMWITHSGGTDSSYMNTSEVTNTTGFQGIAIYRV